MSLYFDVITGEYVDMDDKKQCSKCREIKLYEEFHNNRNTKDGKGGWCKECFSTMRRREYTELSEYITCSRCGETKSSDYFYKNKYRSTGVNQECKECTRLRFVVHRVTINRKLVEYLLEHPCVDCGESDPVVLQFDHVGDKNFDISGKISWRRLQTELSICEVRCANCHVRRHAVENDRGRYNILNQSSSED